MVRVSVLNDGLKTMYNAEKRGKRQVLLRPSSKVVIKFLQVMQRHGESLWLMQTAYAIAYGTSAWPSPPPPRPPFVGSICRRETPHNSYACAARVNVSLHRVQVTSASLSSWMTTAAARLLWSSMAGKDLPRMPCANLSLRACIRLSVSLAERLQAPAPIARQLPETWLRMSTPAGSKSPVQAGSASM